MNSKEFVEITYKKSLNLLTVKGWFFRNPDLDTRCIEVIDSHLKDKKKLSIIIKVELIDAVSFGSLANLISHLNTLSKKNDIQIKWLSSSESMIAGQRLKNLAKFPFHTALK